MKIVIALTFTLFLNVVLFAAQLAVEDAVITENITSPVPTIFSYENSLLSDYDAGNFTLDQNLAGQLPNAAGQVDASTEGNIFTDTFVAIGAWLSETTGAKYLYGIVTAFPNLLKGMGLPPEIAYALGVVWHAVTFFLIVAVMRGIY